jgi:hypothetical protein
VVDVKVAVENVMEMLVGEMESMAVVDMMNMQNYTHDKVQQLYTETSKSYYMV